jgi:hypothetical protein
MSQTNCIGRTATFVRTDSDGRTVVRYHQTDVVAFDAESIRLNSGGWRTATTKLRMNQTANQFGLGFSVYQHKFEWFVCFGGMRLEYIDGMVLSRKDGNVSL